MSKSAKARPLLALVFAVPVGIALAQPPGCAESMFSDARTGEKVWRNQPSQINPPKPKFDYTDEGRAIMIKRFPYFPTQDICQFQKYRFAENKLGVEHVARGKKLKREPDEILSEEQKEVLREWGQPDYLRGPYKSTRFDSVVEWAYHPLNHLFQWVDGVLVYEGPLTDQERVAITYGAPREATIRQLQPNVRRETWIYRPWFLPMTGATSRERIFDFANGKLLYSQESP